MNLPRANSPEQAWSFSTQAIHAAKAWLANPNPEDLENVLSKLNIAGKDILRKRSGLSRLSEIETLQTEIAAQGQNTWYERQIKTDIFTTEVSSLKVPVKVMRVLMQVLRHHPNQATHQSHQYAGLVMQPQQDCWEEGPIATVPKNRSQDLKLSEYNPIYAAEPMAQTIERIKAAKGNVASKAKILQGLYWDIEALANVTRNALYEGPTSAFQSAMWITDSRSEGVPPLVLNDLKIDVSADNWDELVKPHLFDLWNLYLAHPEDREPSDPIELHQHFDVAFKKATGQIFRID